MLKQTTVHILLATYNGASYLTEQLESIARQTHSEWTLTVSDDGSTDETVDIVQLFATQVTQPVSMLHGPKAGSSTTNFCHLIAQAPADNEQDLYAFCDQDDVWHDDKLERAVNWHAQHPSHPARLYCGRTQFVNEKLHPIGLSPNIKRPPNFGNALVQNIASGNTMVFSHSILTAQKKVLPQHCVWHDWTTYIVATAIGGLVWFDEKPSLLYRQHERNVIGANTGIRAQFWRMKLVVSGRYKYWLDSTEKTICDISSELTLTSLNIFKKFKKIRNSRSVISIFDAFFNSEIRRQTTLSNTSLLIALIFRLA